MTTRNLKTGSQVKGTIREIAFGGAGLLKIDGFVLFVPFTAPGDEIVAEITRLKKGYGEAKLIEVVKLSPLRTAPKCPYFEKCMGCQFQHVEYNAQLEIKRKNVEDALRRIGKLEIPEIEVVGSQKEYGYRERITLHLKKGRLGYIEKDNTSLLEIESCPIFCEEKAIFHALKHLFPTSSGRVQVTKSGQGFLVFADVDEFIETEVPPLIKGLHVAYKKNSFKKGTFTQFCEIDGLKIEYTPQTFIQNNFSQSLNIYREICASLYEDNKILDLYSGIG
ncbi:MAG: class I SAM-dependent RNA methyltransferase, partial [Parachlamydiaceae bacterium]